MVSHSGTRTTTKQFPAASCWTLRSSCGQVKCTATISPVSSSPGAYSLLQAHSEHSFPAPSSNSARFSYATEEVLFISAQLSIDAVSALRKVRVLIRL